MRLGAIRLVPFRAFKIVSFQILRCLPSSRYNFAAPDATGLERRDCQHRRQETPTLCRLLQTLDRCTQKAGLGLGGLGVGALAAAAGYAAAFAIAAIGCAAVACIIFLLCEARRAS